MKFESLAEVLRVLDMRQFLMRSSQENLSIFRNNEIAVCLVVQGVYFIHSCHGRKLGTNNSLLGIITSHNANMVL